MTGSVFFFFFKDTATPMICTLPLPHALPIFADDDELPVRAERQRGHRRLGQVHLRRLVQHQAVAEPVAEQVLRSEEHTSELQSRQYLVCRLLLEKKTTTLSLVPSSTVT